ncbi:unnamed protein product, partial [Rotaria sp. Silwood2]
QEVLFERVNEILDREKRVFTLNHYYMDTVNKLKEKDKKKNNVHDERNALSASLSSKGASTAIGKNSADTVAYAPMSNEAQAAQDIQNALHAYSKLDQLLSAAIPSSQLLQYMREPHKYTYRRNKLTRSIQAYEEALQFGQTYM